MYLRNACHAYASRTAAQFQQAGGFYSAILRVSMSSLCSSFVRLSEGYNTNNTKQTTRGDEERGQYRPKPIRKAAYILSFIGGPKGERMYRSQRQLAGPSGSQWTLLLA